MCFKFIELSFSFSHQLLLRTRSVKQVAAALCSIGEGHAGSSSSVITPTCLPSPLGFPALPDLSSLKMGKQRIREEKGLAPSPKDTRSKHKCALALLAPSPSTGLGTGATRTRRHRSLPEGHDSLMIVFGGVEWGRGVAPAAAVAEAASQWLDFVEPSLTTPQPQAFAPYLLVAT